MENRAGSFASKLYGELAYQSFLPSPLPPSPAVMNDRAMTQLLAQAMPTCKVLINQNGRTYKIC